MSARRRPRPPHHAPAEPAEDQPVELSAIARRAGVRVSLVRHYVSFGLFEPCSEPGKAPLFQPSCAARLAKAERLRRDLGLNYAGAVLVCELLDRIRELEDQRVSLRSSTS